MTQLPSPAAVPQIDIRVHGDFVDWLAASGGTLAATTYNSGKLAMVAAPEGRLAMCVVKLARPMGVAYDSGRLAAATRDEIREWRLGADGAVLQLAATHATGRLDAHELAYDARGLCFANTRFNCIARPSERASFRLGWRPPFLSRVVGRDCCHLNGIGVRGGRVAMATAFGVGDEPGSWRSGERFRSGVLLDVRSSEVVARGLCMPHSPRWHGGRWWLCNSGEGTLCAVDPQTGACEPAAVLPGFTRGLTFAAGRAVVGLSRIRKEHILDAPPVRERFRRLRSGLWLVDPATGRLSGALEFVRGGREVFDVAFLPGIVQPILQHGPAVPESR